MREAISDPPTTHIRELGKIMEFKNLTPHKVVLDTGGVCITFEREALDPVARVDLSVEESRMEHELAPGVRVILPVNVVSRTSITGLPEPKSGVIYIVSSMVATHAKRADVIAPLTDATAVRDGAGRIVSVKGFQTFTESAEFIRELALVHNPPEREPVEV
jgi:hypothetical protein